MSIPSDSRGFEPPSPSPRTRHAETATVVICAYTERRWSLLEEAVASVLEQIPPPQEVLVVVDHNPRLEERARATFDGPGVRVLANTSNSGLSGARNVGTAAATGSVVAFLDDDAAARPGWLSAHLSHYEDERVLGVGGLVIAHWESGMPPWFPAEFGWVVGCSYSGQPTEAAEVRNPIGANMSFRRTVLERVGGFAHELGRVGAGPRGCEETELSVRARVTIPEGRIMYEPQAVVDHHVPDDRATVRYFARRCWGEGLSKADMAAMAGAPEALSTERSYVTGTLVPSFFRNVLEGVRSAQLQAAGRSIMISLGLTVTAAGYLAGRLGGRAAAGHPY